MKKVTFFIFLLFGYVVANAQKTSSVNFGVKGGITFADYFRDNFPPGTKPGMDWSISFHSGITMNTPLKKNMFAVETELLYAGAGSKIILDRTNPQSSRFDQRFYYLSLPVLLQWKNEHGFLAETGFVPAYLLKAKQIGPGSYKTDDISSFNKFDLSWAWGIGYASKVRLGMDIRYNYGLTRVLPKNSSSFYPAKATLHNSVIQVGLNWRFKR